MADDVAWVRAVEVKSAVDSARGPAHALGRCCYLPRRRPGMRLGILMVHPIWGGHSRLVRQKGSRSPNEYC